MAAANAPELHIRNLGDRDPIPDQSLDFVLELLAADRGILVLSGAKGTWKTGAGCYALSQVEDGVYVKVEDVLHIAFEDRAKLERVRSASIVLLDEVGGNIPDPKGHLLATLNSWIDWWYGSCARIVITTNLERPGFDALLDARALDRLREVGKFVTLEGDSKRRKQPWGSR